MLRQTTLGLRRRASLEEACGLCRALGFVYDHQVGMGTPTVCL